MRVSESKECLITEEDGISSRQEYAERPERTCRDFRRHKRTITVSRAYSCVLHILVVVLLLLCLYLRRNHKFEQIGYEPFAPELTSMVYLDTEKSIPPHTSSSIYSGSPTRKNNGAWDDLIRPLYFNASEIEVASAFPSFEPEDYIEVVDGGYLASLEVYHQLHCLRQLRMWTFKETFHTTLSTADSLFLENHLGHCIESLRASITCNPSLQVNLFRWREKSEMPSDEPSKPFEPVLQPRKCVNWDSIDNWARKRSISLAPKLLKPVNPAGNE